MKLRHLIIPLAALMMLLSACSKQLELLDAIPSDVNAACSVNCTKFFKELGIKVDTAGNVTLPPGVDSVNMRVREHLSLMGRVSKAVDSHHVMVINTTKGEPYIVFSITDPEAFDRAMAAAACERTDTEGFAVYVDNGYSVAVADGMGWVVFDRVDDTVAFVKKTLSAASKSSLSDVKGIEKVLGSDDMLVMVASSPFKSSKGKKSWGCVNMRVKDNAIVGEVSLLDPSDGGNLSKGLKRIDTPVLRYAPDNASIVCAAGFTPGVPWDQSIAAMTASGVLNSVQQAQMQMLLPYLKALDGTSMVAFSIEDGGDLAGVVSGRDLDRINFIIMLQMERKMLNQAVGSATEFASQLGTVRNVGDGLYCVPAMDRTFYIGDVDGCFTLSSFKPTLNDGSSIAARFTGKKAGVSLRIPSLDVFIPSKKFGIDFNFTQKNDNEADIDIRLIGTDDPILQALFFH